MPIKRIHARQIYDSRGNPTIEVDLTTERGIFRAAVPSGASTGIYEALELRDKADTWHGKGVMKAVHNVNNMIAPEIVAKCMDPVEQEKIDGLMLALDATDNKVTITQTKQTLDKIANSLRPDRFLLHSMFRPSWELTPS